MNIEIFKPIINYEELYEISNYGNVLSKRFNKYMKLVTNSQGYRQVSLSKNKKVKTFKIHRLIAIHFIPNDDENRLLIDHINNVKTDNRIENLRWVNYEGNNQNQRISINNKSGYKGVSYNKKYGKWVAQICYKSTVMYLGLYKDIYDAVKIRREKANELYKENTNICEKINHIEIQI